MTKPAPIVTCGRCGGTLYPGLHYCFGSYHERKTGACAAGVQGGVGDGEAGRGSEDTGVGVERLGCYTQPLY
jgi:hypothetical protein